jgi:Fur family ferric uptake transcriptional regulator
MRKTTAKSEIQELILSSSVALSHTEIKEVTKGLCDRVTIYRVLERLVEEGIIHKIINLDGVVKYAGCHSCSIKHNHNHIHFSCQKCKAVTCLDDVEPSFMLPKNYKVSEMNFTLSGLCPQCL